jgi:3-keto-5-aminohexanoate cleavage enzyme
MNLSIEKASQRDRDGIIEVLRQWNMHHIPSLEMAELDLSCVFVAKLYDRIVGVGGYKMLSETEGKTTVLAVYPEFQGFGIGRQLQEKRLDALHGLGAKTVTTNCDRPLTVVWYKKYFGYEEIGQLRKLCSFGREDIDHWTTLRMDLVKYIGSKQNRAAEISDYIQQNDPYPLAEFPPLIINVCLTGMVPTKLSTPFVPLSVDEIIQDAIRVYDAGASIVHIHARDDKGVPAPDATYYERIIKGIRNERPDMVCCVTTSGRNWSDFERRSEVLRLSDEAKPDMASLTLGSLNFLSGPSSNSIETIEQLAQLMKERNIKPELEIFDTGMVNVAKYLERHRIITGRKYFNIILGNMNTASATIGNIDSIVKSLPANSLWSVGGLGKFQLPMNVASIIGGGHVRVGIEDSIFYDYSQNQLGSNVDLVKRLVRIAKEIQRPIATAKQTREMLGL